MAQQFPHLFSPIQLGPVTVRNRIVMSAHFTRHTMDFVPNDRIIAYWAARARGGVGLIGMQLHWIHAVPERNPFYHPQMLVGLRRAAERTLATLTPSQLALLQAYADGVNAWLATNPLPQS